MNFILILKELWRRRVLVAGSIALAAVVATVAVYDVSGGVPAKRVDVEAHGSIDILVDAPRSRIADVGRDLEPLSARAGVFARYIASGNVVRRIAEKSGVAAEEIEVEGPPPQPGDPVIADAGPAIDRPYAINVVQRGELPILNVRTRAPTEEQAAGLAAAAPAAVAAVVGEIQRQQRIAPAERVTFRALGPAEAKIVRDAFGAKAAVGAFLALLAVLLLAILAVPRFVAAWRGAEQGPEPWRRDGNAIALTASEGDVDDERMRALVTATIGPAEGSGEHARLKSSGGDGPEGRAGSGPAQLGPHGPA